MTVAASVTTATSTCVPLYICSSIFGTYIAISMATGASPNPMTAITGPTTTGGNKLINHWTPNVCNPRAITPYNAPAKNPPIIAPSGPDATDTIMIGLINAKLEPKYAGTLPRVMNRYTIVPSPLEINATDTGRSVKCGTNIVAPNIAKRC